MRWLPFALPLWAVSLLCFILFALGGTWLDLALAVGLLVLPVVMAVGDR